MASPPNLSPARIKARPGVPYPLGATYDRSGVNFVLGLGGRYSGRSLPVRRSRGRSGDGPLRGAEQTDRVWRVYLGQRYGYCVLVHTSHKLESASTTRSSCSIPMLRPSTAPSSGMTGFSVASLVVPRAT